MSKEHNLNKKHYNLNRYSLIVSIIATGIAGWAFLRSCQTDENLDETNYKLSSVTHLPRIKFLKPELTGLDLTQDTTGVTRPLRTDTVDIAMKLRPKVLLKFVNSGNSDARIIGYLMTDTISDNQVIKEYIKKNDSRWVSTDSIFTKYRYHELSPGDTSDVSFTRTLNPVGDRFVIHLLIYYENKLGQLYDTYFWMNGKLNEFGFAHGIDQSTGRPTFIIDENQFWKIIEFKDENSYSEVYSADDRERTLKYLKALPN